MSDLLLNVVIIAKRNTSLSFLRALNSVLSQLYSPVRVMVADANEPDSVYSLGLQEDLVAFPEVGYLCLDQSFSEAAIRNRMLETVEGDYIAYLSSNDEWDQTKALLQMQQLSGEPAAGASCCNGVLIDERKTEVSVDSLMEHGASDSSSWLLNNPARRSTQVIYRIEAVREAGGFDRQFVNFCDGDMLLRLKEKHKILILPVSLCKCYITLNHTSYDWDEFQDKRKILYKYMDRFIVNRSMTHEFYGQMLRLSGLNYMWLNYLVYAYMYFIKAPGHTIFMFLKRLVKLLRYIVKWSCREISIGKEGLRISRDIQLLRKGRIEKIKALQYSPRTDQPAGEPLVFSSLRQYNEKNSLDFALNRKLTGIVIPEYVTVIKRGMFYGCDRLASVEIPNTVVEIQPHAFHNCKNLRHVIIGEGSRLGRIGSHTFAGCSSLETLRLPSSVVRIGPYAFAECGSLKQLLFTHLSKGEEKTNHVYPTALRKLSRYTFMGCIRLMSVEFGLNSMLDTLERGVFLGCRRLQNVVLTGRIRSLGSYLFAYCRELKTVAIPQVDAMESIGKAAFLHCQALDYFQFSTKLEHIYERSFYGCSSLKQIKIPKKMLSVNHLAFAKCTSLTDVIILTGDISIASTAFDRHTRLQFPEGSEKR